MQVRFDCREIVRLQGCQQPIGAVIDLQNWSGGVDHAVSYFKLDR